LARLLERRAGLPPALAHEFKLNAHQENIRRQQGDLGQIVTYLRHLPRREKGPRLTSLRRGLLEEGARSQAQRLIEELDAQWESELVQMVRSGAMIRPLLSHGPRNGCPSILGTHNCCWHWAVSVGRSGYGERPRTILRPPSRWPISTRFGSNWRVFSSRPTVRMKPFGTTGQRPNNSPEPPVVAVLSRRAHAQSRGGSNS
jgi:hypothetical protein